VDADFWFASRALGLYGGAVQPNTPLFREVARSAARARETSEESGNSILLLASIRVMQNRTSEAEILLRQAIQEFPHWYLAYEALGQLLKETNRQSEGDYYLRISHSLALRKTGK
jgi:hypothetical protein